RLYSFRLRLIRSASVLRSVLSLDCPAAADACDSHHMDSATKVKTETGGKNPDSGFNGLRGTFNLVGRAASLAPTIPSLVLADLLLLPQFVASISRAFSRVALPRFGGAE